MSPIGSKSDNRESTNFFRLSKYDISELRKNNKESKYTFRKPSYKARSTLMARSGKLPFVIYRIWKGEKSSYTHGSQIWPPFRTCSLGYIKQTLDKVQTRVYDVVTCPAHMNRNDHWTIEDKDKTKLHTKNKT